MPYQRETYSGLRVGARMSLESEPCSPASSDQGRQNGYPGSESSPREGRRVAACGPSCQFLSGEPPYPLCRHTGGRFVKRTEAPATPDRPADRPELAITGLVSFE